MAQVIFAQLLVTAVFIVLALAVPQAPRLEIGATEVSLGTWYALFLAATGGWQWAHDHECRGPR